MQPHPPPNPFRPQFGARHAAAQPSQAFALLLPGSPWLAHLVSCLFEQHPQVGKGGACETVTAGNAEEGRSSSSRGRSVGRDDGVGDSFVCSQAAPGPAPFPSPLSTGRALVGCRETPYSAGPELPVSDLQVRAERSTTLRIPRGAVALTMVTGCRCPSTLRDASFLGLLVLR